MYHGCLLIRNRKTYLKNKTKKSGAIDVDLYLLLKRVRFLHFFECIHSRFVEEISEILFHLWLSVLTKSVLHFWLILLYSSLTESGNSAMIIRDNSVLRW